MAFPGGKGKCFQRLINLMPPHRVYIETHLGGGAVLRHKRPAHVSIGIDKDWRAIERSRTEIGQSCELVHGDAIAFLEAYSYAGDELIYADPPYVASTRRKRRIYRHEYPDAEHERLLGVLKGLPCMVMLSGYDSELYGRQLRDWRIERFRINSQAGPREECVWMNFPAPSILHDAAYLGNSFHERQAIRRRRERLEVKLSKLESRERHELLRFLTERFGLTDQVRT